MKNKISIGIWMCLLWLIIGNCVDEFDAHLSDNNKSLLVVEGNIVSDSAVVFSLSRSFSLNVEGLPPDYNLVNAEVSVVGNDGSCFNGVALGQGKYQVVIGTLSKDIGYSLKIVYDGDTYTSEPQQPIVTEGIDNVSFEQPESYGDIHIKIATHSQEAAYYMWTYEEDWEVRAEYSTVWFYDPLTGNVILYSKPPYALGWCHASSPETLVGTTGSSIGNRLENKRLYSIAASDHRVSCYYSSLIQQRQLSKGEYEYYQEKVKLNEGMGGLFTPQPSELPTNIVCSDPDKQVIGYVGVNMNVATQRLYISNKDIQYDNQLNCRLLEGEEVLKYTDDELYAMGFRLVSWSGFGREFCYWAPKECTDVRELGATLEKPSFWPDEIN